MLKSFVLGIPIGLELCEGRSELGEKGRGRRKVLATDRSLAESEGVGRNRDLAEKS